MSITDCLRRTRIVLKDTTHPGNIGAAARAMKTMGVERLYLTAPRTLIDEKSRALAAGATDVLDNVTILPTLPKTIADCTHVFALTARRRDLSPPEINARQAGEIAAHKLADGGEVAFVFGGERSGLENEDIERAGYAVSIPTSGAYWSLNLSQAVQIVMYELRQAVLLLHAQNSPQDSTHANLRHSITDKRGIVLPLASQPAVNMPSQAELEMLMAHGGEFLTAIEMSKRSNGKLLRARLRRLLTRAALSAAEVRMLRGVLKAAIKHTKK
ncbi:MAG: RNA methyltransferase [Gammaproteobacteria bacterium WSBS_2016_MAG_OTU1]